MLTTSGKHSSNNCERIKDRVLIIKDVKDIRDRDVTPSYLDYP